MDVSVNPTLESVRPYFQSLPATSGGSGSGSGGPAASPSHPGVATPVQPPPPVVSSPSYWPQRSKAPPTPPHFAQSAKSPALASPLHHVFNGTKLPEEPQRHHNLPPIAALSSSVYQHPRAVRDLASQGALLHRQPQHVPLPSISQITPLSSAKTSTPSVSPRTTQSQFRTPDYPQSNHHSIYGPNLSSNQSHRSSSSGSSYQPHLLPSKYQSSPGSPAVSSPSPHAYSYSPRTSLSATTTTASSPVYPQTTAATSVYVSSSHHHRHLQQPQHPSHHPVSPVIQQPSQPEMHGHLKLHHHYPPVSSQQPPQYSSRTVLQQQPSLSSQPSLQTHQHQMTASYQQHKSSAPTAQHNQGHVQQMSHQQPQHHSAQQRSAPQHQQSRGQHQPRGQHQLAQQPHNQQHLLTQQHQQLQQQAAMYNQSIQQNSNRQSDAEKLAEMQQVLRMKERQLAAVQAQQQAYYAAVSSNNASRPTSQTTTSTVEASNHQRTTTTQALTGGLKRESPLDLSVKTVRQSADSTAKDDSESAYLANFQSHEAFQQRIKGSVKTSSPRTSTLLPSLQLPSTVVYPHFENHSSGQTAAVSGAPKVDFTPNFNTHHSSTGSSLNFQDPHRRQRKSSTSQLPSPSQYPPHMGSLPHMGSFKKSSLTSAAYDDPNKQSQYYPATGPPGISRSSALNNPSLNVQPNFVTAPSSQYSYDCSKRGSSMRYDLLERRSSSSSLQSSSSVESNYTLGKRPPSLDLRHPLPQKIPRVVDTWRQTIDQQIEQRLNSYVSSQAKNLQINGTTKENLNNDPNLHQQTPSSYSVAPTIQTSQSATYMSSNGSSKSSLLQSQRSNSSSKLNLTNQYFPHGQQQYPHQAVPNRQAQEPYNNLAQVKLPSLPNNGAADKRVLSILRKRLDTREATNQLVQQQLQPAPMPPRDDRSKMYSSLAPRYYPQPLVVPSPVISSPSKTPLQTPVARHNLPHFNALSLERNATTSYPTQKLHIPKAMDSVAPDHSQSSIPLRMDVVPRSQLPSRSEASGKPPSGENGGDYDGLAAFLAARIRTKAELKQVGPSMEQQRTPTPASGSNSSAQSPRTTPGIFSPPPTTQLQYPAVPGDFNKGTPTSESDRASSSGMSGNSPMKPKDKYGINSPRRRLFCRPEDETGEGVIQARERGLRSSSETSVFDFRESDSDGETGSERQSLTDMRKDRDRRLQERQQTTTAPSPDPTLEDYVGEPEPIDDSFWSGMCDQFVTQLQKGGNTIRKRGRQKKCAYTPFTESESTGTIEQLDNAQYEPSSADLVPQLENIKVEKDIKPSDEIVEEAKVMSNEEAPTNTFTSSEETTVTAKEEIFIPKESIKKEEESSDEDAPLSLRQTELKKVKETKPECSDTENKSVVNISPECDKLELNLVNNKQEDLKTDDFIQDNKESSDSEAESSADDESITSVSKRLRLRKPKEETPDSKRKTRSSEKESPSTPQRGKRKKKHEKKKSLYGDGSEFRPGWEAEVYRYKRSLRMPVRLINIAGPPSWPRLSVSLPDLDPDSPMTLDSDISLQNKRFESDGESTPTKTKPKDSPKNKSSQKKVEEKGEEDSFLNRLIQRYGGKGKKSLRKGQEKDNLKERKGPKIIPQTTELQLLPTPSLDCIVKSPAKKINSNGLQAKQMKGKKSNKNTDKSTVFENQESIYLGYFRKKTVTDFRDAFAKHNGGFATEHELPPIMLKSRTRTQTRILTQRATIREVFGEDRPASAPPAGCRDEESEEIEKPSCEEKKLKKSSKKSKAILSKRNSTCGMSPGTRSGLRSAAVLRSNKAVLKSKQQLLHGNERRKRSKDLIKAFTSNKKYQHQEPPLEDHSTILEAVVKLEPIGAVTKVVEEEPVLVSGKRLKYRSVRRKLKSSGFDYIRKKKKQQLKKEGDTDSVKEKKKIVPLKPNLESEEDIQNEIKCWVINKGLGETVLHRAARLGYTDIAAYCLEKMDHNPSPRDNAGYTPLHEACSKGRLDIARLLLLYGADVSDSAQGGIRPLHEAAESGCVELIRLLLSYGADPQLATYSGLTPLALAHHHPEARTLLQNYLADVQGQPASPWHHIYTDATTLGNDVLADPPSPDPCEEEMEVESGELSLPHLYQLLGEPLTDRWVLFQELGPVLKVKTREALIKQLGQSHRNDFRDLKMTDFYDMARCCSILGVGDYILNPKAHKVTLVKYSDRVRALLNSEKLLVTAR